MSDVTQTDDTSFTEAMARVEQRIEAVRRELEALLGERRGPREPIEPHRLDFALRAIEDALGLASLVVSDLPLADDETMPMRTRDVCRPGERYADMAIGPVVEQAHAPP